MKNAISSKNRRQFLKYLVAGTAGTVAMGWMFPASSQSSETEDLETLCTTSPNNSRCADYLPGVRATDSRGNPIEANALLSNTTPGSRVLVKGLTRAAYLVITEGPEIAEYAISAVCTHLRCTVDWKPERNIFICPCHGSEYDAQGNVILGPASRPLSRVTVVIKKNQVRLVNRPPAINPRANSR